MIELTEKQRGEIASTENILWTGRPSPTLFYRGWIGHVVMGLLWGTVVYCGPIRSVLVKDRYDIYEAPVSVFLGTMLGLGLFVLIALAHLLSPIIRWMISRQTTWVVTTQRVIRFWGPLVHSWHLCELLVPICVDGRKNGHVDFVFCRKAVPRSKGSGMRIREWSIDNVAPADVPMLDAAFRHLAEKKSTYPRKSKERFARMADEFYNSKPSAERGVGEYY